MQKERHCKSPHKSETGIWVWKGSVIFLILSRIDILNSIKSISSIHDINISENHIVDTVSINDIVNIHSINIMHFLHWYLYMYICIHTNNSISLFVSLMILVLVSIRTQGLSNIMYSAYLMSNLLPLFLFFLPSLVTTHLHFSVGWTSRRSAKAVPWNYHGIAMATVASRPSRVVTAAWSIRAQHDGTSAPYGAWRESWRIVALYDMSWREKNSPLKLWPWKFLRMEGLEDDFPVQRADFQVLATSFRGSICWWKRGRNIEKLVGDDASGVQGEG